MLAGNTKNKIAEENDDKYNKSNLDQGRKNALKFSNDSNGYLKSRLNIIEQTHKEMMAKLHVEYNCDISVDQANKLIGNAMFLDINNNKYIVIKF